MCLVGSHRFGHFEHIDTSSHLGLDESWSFDDAVAIDGKAGDAIFFHIHTVHGSTPNRSNRSRATFINRYTTCDDYQAYFATDTKMREIAKAEYEANLLKGILPIKERNVVVGGRRKYDGNIRSKIDASVNH